ncbi:ABC transporter ATP-binding protein [Treponema sp. OMZ 799]|uniref:ABC transporter ATP-binding protein n=1 Tax=Treponema sp. OMZ 799 TaxID=2563668 RepID=UPI0020A2727E|nr:ABC transporter ATP-binding protein [Treponema sp. OMZ 799]UTC77301.1 ABC transporter ATP-binding protein [Treponema sp. OMZ 799]
MNLIKKYISKNKGMYAASIFCALLEVAMGLITYITLAGAAAALIEGNRDMQFYTKAAGIILICFTLKEIFAAISTSISHRATFSALKDIRKDISDKMFKMPLGDILNISSGKLKNILVEQVDSMETTLAHLVPEMTANIAGPVILLVYMFILDWRLGLLSLVPLVIGMMFMKTTMKSYGTNYAESVKINQGMNSAVVEYINGIEVIKTFNQNEKSYKKYSDAVYDNASFYYKWMKQCMVGVSAYRTICPMMLLTILPFGVLFYLNNLITPIHLITIIILSFGTIENIIAATNALDDLARINTITGEINGILESKELVHAETRAEIPNYNIEFKNVEFSYKDGKKILNGLNLLLKEKQITAIVGPSGSGKSTIIRLIAGFWDTTAGRLSIGGTDIKDIPLEQLSEIISYVSQDNYLFDMSIRENIRIGKPDASDEEIESIAKKSGCDEFIRNLEHGYDTISGQGGSRLSGGEKQRISIARAMLKNAPIVILDEATAYMDTENESLMQKAIGTLVQGKTLIVVAHRLRTVVNADNIVVIENGSVESTGTHTELLEKSALYRSMWEAALKGEE